MCQVELASALEEQGHLFWSMPGEVLSTLDRSDFSSLKAFPEMDSSRFVALLGEEVGLCPPS